MKKILLALTVFLCGAASAEVVVLDLSKSAAIEYAAIEYNEKNIWNDVYKEGALIQSQEFTFSHVSSSAFYYNGFFASKSTAVLESSNFDDQWGCMAKGGYAGEGTPYLVAYWDAYADSISGEKSCEVTLSSPYYAAGFYVCNNPFTYYTIQKGNRLVEKFETGDWFKMIVHGVDAQGSEVGKVEYYLADYRGKDSNTWTLNKSWEWVDLSPLGRVASIYFTMESSRPGERGPRTPTFFCLDRLTVLTTPSSVEEVAAPAVKAYYNRAADVVHVDSAEPTDVALYHVSGALVKRQSVHGSADLDMTSCPSGIYVIYCGKYKVKIVK